MTNTNALGAIKEDGVNLFQQMSKLARKVDEREFELERAKVTASVARQANNAANHVMRACRYDYDTAKLKLDAQRLALDGHKLAAKSAEELAKGL